MRPSKNFNINLLLKSLDEFDDIYKAEEHIRSYPISLKEKAEVLSSNELLNELRFNKRDYSPKFQLNKVVKR